MSSFRKEYEALADAIKSHVVVTDAVEIGADAPLPSYYYSESATWDTGAQFTFISPRIVEALGLKPSGRGRFMGIGGDQESYTYKVHIVLSNGKVMHNAEVFCSELDDYDMLIGMDIITQTDFLITNKDGKTTFQLRTPSEGGVEL